MLPLLFSQLPLPGWGRKYVFSPGFAKLQLHTGKFILCYEVPKWTAGKLSNTIRYFVSSEGAYLLWKTISNGCITPYLRSNLVCAEFITSSFFFSFYWDNSYFSLSVTAAVLTLMPEQTQTFFFPYRDS